MIRNTLIQPNPLLKEPVTLAQGVDKIDEDTDLSKVRWRIAPPPACGGKRTKTSLMTASMAPA